MEKLDLTTPNFTDENIQKLSELFPNCVTESSDGKVIDFDALKQELSDNIVEGNKERYQLTWPGKSESLVTANTPIDKTLRPNREESKNFDNTENLYIEGDNLEVLKLLQETYLGKIKMIYIDPPYNTGKDFVYKDNFTQDKAEYDAESGNVDDEGGCLVSNPDSNGRYHSDWLSMMYPRLKLAKKLLKDDGVLFISIDDNEVSNLKQICNDLFGEKNVKVIAVKMSEASGLKMASVISSGSIPKLKEYVIIIKKNGVKGLYFDKISKNIWDNEYNTLLSNFTREDKELIEKFQLKEKTTEADLRFLDDMVSKVKLKSVSESLKENGIEEKNKENWLFENAWRIIRTTASDSVYKLAVEKKQKCDKDLFFVKSSTGLIYFVKANFSNESKKPRLQIIFANDNLDTHPGDFWGHIKTTGLDNEGGVPYKNGKKPLSLLKALIKSNTFKDKESIVLDFFSGSASTAHAVMQMNAKEGYSLKFIMAQLNENLDESLMVATGDQKKEIKEVNSFLDSIGSPHILTELGKERIRRAGEKIKEDNADKDGIDELDIGFRVLKVDSSNMKDVYFTPNNTEQSNLFDRAENIKDGRDDEDLLFMVLLDWGIDLSVKIERREVAGKTVYFADKDFLAACFKDNLDEDFVKALVAENPLKVVFRDNGFANDSVKINVEQIFKQADIEVKVI